jgi:hypothetical protein
MEDESLMKKKINIGWNKIKEKYPKSFASFWRKHPDINIPVCYCDIESFFDENSIIINILIIKYGIKRSERY